MHLVSLDIDGRGERPVSHLGPFSSSLNVVCGPTGSGKTTLIRRLIESIFGIVDRNRHSEYANGSLPALDQLTWSDERGLFRITNRVAQGKFGSRQIEHRPGWSDAIAWRPWVNEGDSLPKVDRQSFADLFASTDLDFLSAQPIWRAVRRLGLHSNPLPANTAQRVELESRRLQLERELSELRPYSIERVALENRRRELEATIARIKSTPPSEVHDLTSKVALEESLQLAKREIERLESLSESLHREVNRIQEALNSLDGTVEPVDYRARIAAGHSTHLREIDQQLHRWRRTLQEIQAHRTQLEQSSSGLRLERQLDFISPGQAVDPREPLRALENQILNTRRHLEQLVDLYTSDDRSKSQLDRSLPGTLRAMQEDLYDVCRQLSRKEAENAARQLTGQISQLKRCEAELEQSIEKLIDDRSRLLAEISSEQKIPLDQLTLAFGDDCRCVDHPHVRTWVGNEELRAIAPREDLSTRRSLLRNELDAATLRLRRNQEELDRQEQSARRLERELYAWKPVVVESRWHELPLLERQLSDVQRELDRYDRYQHVHNSLDEVNRQLAALPQIDREQPNRILQSAEQWLDRFSGGRYRVLPAWALEQALDHFYSESPRSSDDVDPARDYSLSRRVDIPLSRTEEAALVHLSLRAAVVSAFRVARTALPFIVDDTFQSISPSLWKWVVAGLADLARDGQQVIVLTASDEVASLIRSHQGWACYLRAIDQVQPARFEPAEVVPFKNRNFFVPQRVQLDRDTLEANRHLHALANDELLEPAVDYPATGSYRKLAKYESFEPSSRAARGPYFLARGSLVEESPSITPELATKLRRYGIDRVGDLLQVDPDWLAAQLQLQGLTGKTVRRWQTEAHLACDVAQLRPFDARILVGSGIRTPRQLAEIHPGLLVQNVQEFLATERGKAILQSGSSYEISRITSWIASANRTVAKAKVIVPSVHKDHKSDLEISRESVAVPLAKVLNRHSVERVRVRVKPRSASDMRKLERRQKLRQLRRSEVAAAQHQPEESDSSQANEPQATARPVANLEKRRQSQLRREDIKHISEGEPTVRMKASTEKRLRYFLELSSGIEMAPSIGNRLAERLIACGIRTVNELLQADAESLASQIGGRKVNGDLVRSWQQQASLVCRVPNLRGHDAQLLVSAGINSPERLSKANPNKLLEDVLVIAHSADGQRILRGAQAPDRAEVLDWIEWANHSRALRAA